MSSQFYVDNVNVDNADTIFVRGNKVSDCYGNTVKGISVKQCVNVRMKNNSVVRMRSWTKNSIGFELIDNNSVVAIYNVASRCNKGFFFRYLSELYVYNLTSHDCTTHVHSYVNGYFYNVALSVLQDWKDYNNSTGFLLEGTAEIYVDFTYYYGLKDFSSGGTAHLGSTVEEKHLLYFDEQNDDLTPDHISEAVKAGTTNPLGTTDPSIGGIQSPITDEYTADRLYQYDLIDNSFWNVEDDYSAEMSFIKAFQSRILANSESATKQTVRDFYIKTASSTLSFSEVYPTYTYYQNASLFKKKVMNLWYAGQNVGATFSYNTAIGGYHLLTSFFTRLEDWADGWVIDVSFVDENNYLLGREAQQYGIGIDVLGVSTMSKGASAECYTNTMECVADIGEVKWFIHDEVQPPNYVMFADLYNGFENCVLDNMFYYDDLAIAINQVETDGQILTPLISTEGLNISGTPSGSVSGYVELSTLERIFSENVTRTMYYRVGDTSSSMSSWTTISRPIGEILDLDGKEYIQFKLDLSGILRQIDYEFLGLCMRFVPVYTNVLPRILSVEMLNDTEILITFNKNMGGNSQLFDPNSYIVT